MLLLLQMEEGLLRAVDAIHVATVLEDCVDQLAVLGRIMPASFESRPDAQEVRFMIKYRLTHLLYCVPLFVVACEPV